jgi:outer membrane autotransporter protein
LGGTVSYGFKWKGIGWNPYVQAGWAHEFLDADQAVSARFASGAGDVFSTTGDNLGHDAATFGAGLQAILSETLTANLSYSGEANGQYQDHSFNAAVRVEF